MTFDVCNFLNLPDEKQVWFLRNLLASKGYRGSTFSWVPYSFGARLASSATGAAPINRFYYPTYPEVSQTDQLMEEDAADFATSEEFFGAKREFLFGTLNHDLSITEALAGSPSVGAAVAASVIQADFAGGFAFKRYLFQSGQIQTLQREQPSQLLNLLFSGFHMDMTCDVGGQYNFSWNLDFVGIKISVR